MTTHPPPDPPPFAPPPGYRFEPEFDPPVPRPIPPELHRGRYARRRRAATAGLLAGGLLCLLAGMLPIVHFAGLYFLPLQYLSWIGVGLLCLLPLGPLIGLLRPSPSRYVREGTPVVARVRHLVLTPTATHDGQTTSYAFVAHVDYAHPVTGQPIPAEVRSNEIPAPLKHTLTTSYRVGDYVTAVCLPHDPHSTLRLYGFLDLRPGLGVVPRPGENEARPGETVAAVCFLFAFFAVLFWNVYAFDRFQPLDFSFRQGFPPFAAGALLFGGGTLALFVRHARRTRARREQRNRAAHTAGEPVELAPPGETRLGTQGAFITLLTALGLAFLGGLTTVCWALSANALLDDSPARMRPVRITDMITETHKGMLREYKIKYRFPGEPTHSSRELPTTPDHMNDFETDAGLAELHTGRFGWTWVKTIHPLHPRPPENNPSRIPRPHQGNRTYPLVPSPGTPGEG